MATIRSAIQVYDGFSGPLKSITNALNITINSFEALQTASHNAIDTNSIQTARQELNKAEVTFNQIEQEIKEADNQQKKFNDDIRNGQTAANGMHGAIIKIAAAVGTYLGITKTLNLADQITSTKARLNLMNDGLQTTSELQNMIFASAQRSRGVYLDTTAVVSKLGILAGHAFSSNKEAVFFAEQMNKQFKIGGASVQEQSAAMYQLTQAMASGRLQGDEFRSIMENAPLLAQSIAKYMGKSVGELRELSSEGLITSEIIKNAMFAAADETNRKFAELPMTWEQVWTSIQNKAIKVFEPVLAKISNIANNENFQKFTDGLINSLVIVANVVADVFNLITAIGGFLYDNWSWIAPIVWGVVAAMVAYNVVSLITNGLLAIHAIQATLAGAAQMMQSGATFTATAAQHGLNAALYACPLTWIILLIIGLIALFYGAVAAINHFAGTSISATGVIFGAFTVLGAFLWNLFLGLFDLVLGVVNGLVNPFIRFTNFIGNIFTNPISTIIYMFQGMADNVLMMLEKIASAMDFVFGSTMAETVADWRSGLKQIADDAVKRYAPNENYKTIMNELNLNTNSLGLKRFAYGDAWNVGYSAGESLESFELGSVLDGIFNNTNDTAINTSKISDSMDSSEEELKYLRDLAEQEVINRFTTAEIRIDMGGINNNVNSSVDLDEMVTYLEDKLYETMESAAEGEHV